MCMDGVSLAVMNDERIQQALSSPLLDLVHKQVLFALYLHERGGKSRRVPAGLALVPVRGRSNVRIHSQHPGTGRVDCAQPGNHRVDA